MATGATLEDLIKEVQYELGHNVSTSVGQNFRGHVANRIRREYKRLYEDFEWPHLRKWVDAPTVALTKTVALPLVGGRQVKLGDILEVHMLWGGDYVELERGIEVGHYNSQNSDADEASDPAMRWAPSGETEIEIWPLPASAGSLRFVVKQPFLQMEAESDTCALDDDIVILAAAAEFAARQGTKDAGAIGVRAEQRLKTLRQRLQTGANKVSLAGGGSNCGQREKVFIGVAAVQGTP